MVEQVCSTVVILREGRIVASDRIERLRALMEQPSLEGVFTQLAGQRDAEQVAGRAGGGDEAVTDNGDGVGVDSERDQFRALFRTFLRGLFENDLVPDTVDLRQSALWLAAVFMIPPAVFPFLLSLSYGSWMTDEELALRAVPQKLYFIGYSMAAVGFVTVLVWDKLFPDRRDAIVLGTLPIRPRTIVFARLAALVAVVVGFAIVVNLPGTVLFSLVAGGYLPFEAFLRYPIAHFVATVSAGLLVFLALAALQACIALVLPDRLLRRVSMLAQLLFVNRPDRMAGLSRPGCWSGSPPSTPARRARRWPRRTARTSSSD